MKDYDITDELIIREETSGYSFEKSKLNMEQDIKRLKEKINNIKRYEAYIYDWTETDIQTVENLIKEYKELKEKYNNELDENLKMSEWLVEKQHRIEELEENSIPVSLVEEKIEEYTKLLKNCNRFSDVDRIKSINERILAYKELLEKR